MVFRPRVSVNSASLRSPSAAQERLVVGPVGEGDLEQGLLRLRGGETGQRGGAGDGGRAGEELAAGELRHGNDSGACGERDAPAIVGGVSRRAKQNRPRS